MIQLPSKKILISLFVVIVLLVIIVIFPFSKNGKNNPEEAFGVLSREQIGYFAEKDTDSDGLADWEETLWGTDQDNSDTDGDKASDGEEVLLNRDPRVKGPDDAMKEKVPVSEELEENLTITEKFGRDLFSTYASMINNKRFKGDKTEVLYDLVSENVSAIERPIIYTLKDIKTSNESSDESLRNYGNTLVANFKIALTSNELVVIAKLLETSEKKYELELKNIIEINKKVLNKNLNMPVPEELSLLHLGLLNAHNWVIDSLVKTSKINSDPLVSVVGIGEYSKSTKEFDGVLGNFKEFFSIKGIIFNKNEAGYPLNSR